MLVLAGFQRGSLSCAKDLNEGFHSGNTLPQENTVNFPWIRGFSCLHVINCKLYHSRGLVLLNPLKDENHIPPFL